MRKKDKIIPSEEQELKDSVPRKNQLKSNLRMGVWLASNGTRAFSDSILSPFIPLYGKSLNATSTQIGLIVSITSLLSVVQIFWAFLAQKFHVARFIAIIASYISSIFNFLFLPIRNIFSFASLRGVQSITFSATLPTSSNILAERTPPRSWPLQNSLLQGILVVGTSIGTLIGGILLWKVPTNLGFPLIFIGAGVISLLSAVLFHLAVPSRKKMESKGRWLQIEEVDLTLGNTLATMKTDKNFVIFCFVNFVFIFGVNISGPFYILFNTSHYDLTVFHAALLTSIGLIPQTISSIITAKLIEKARKKELLIVAGIFASLFPIFFIIPSLAGRLTNVFWILIIFWSVNGTAWGIINSSLTTLLLDIIHPRRRTLQLAINNSLSAIALFIAPILGGLIIEKSNLIYTIFIVSASIRIVGVMLFGFVKEPIIGGTLLRPIQRIIPYILRSNAEKGVTILTTTRPPRRIKSKPKDENN
ncbi:MAG: MFS transporter [Candidatus Heimdallarchaeota archaeon]|nr:MFS transporter [Candidatus Heimdallarchaeota archaeon]